MLFMSARTGVSPVGLACMRAHLPTSSEERGISLLCRLLLQHGCATSTFIGAIADWQEGRFVVQLLEIRLRAPPRIGPT